jgi:hypothetical protein
MVYTTSDTATLIGLRDGLQAQPVAQAIQAANYNYVDAIYYASGSAGSRVYEPQFLNPNVPASFPAALDYLLGTLASPNSPDVVVVYRPGTLVGEGPAVMGTLGLQWEDQHVPLFISGHAVARGVQSLFPARLVDIAPTIETLMGLRPPAVDGVVLADALLNPTSRVLEKQGVAARTLLPWVRAMQFRQTRASG